MSYGNNNEQRGSSGYESGGFQERRDSRDQGGQGGERRGGYGDSNQRGGGYGDNSRGGGGGYGGQRGGFNGQRSFRPRQEDSGPARLYRPYVGTSNQDAPPAVAEKAVRISRRLEQAGYTVRTSGMEGLDDHFEKVQDKELILPWRNFRDKDSKNTFTEDNAKILARQFHPKFDEIKPAAQIFLAKNVRLILGQRLKSPAMFAVIWTEDGLESAANRSPRSGNMGHLVAIASEMRIPVFNLALDDAEERLYRFLGLNNETKAAASSAAPDQSRQQGYNQGQQSDQGRGDQGNRQQSHQHSQGEQRNGQHNQDRGRAHEQYQQRGNASDDDLDDLGY